MVSDFAEKCLVSHSCAEVRTGVCCQFQTGISPLQTAERQRRIALTAASVLGCEWDMSFKLNDNNMDERYWLCYSSLLQTMM